MTVMSAFDRSKVPLPVLSTWVVTDNPLALVVVTVWSLSDPSALPSDTVSTVLPSAASVTVSAWSATPMPRLSTWTVRERPSACVVVTAWSSSVPFAP
jgi:hypothetical protein